MIMIASYLLFAICTQSDLKIQFQPAKLTQSAPLKVTQVQYSDIHVFHFHCDWDQPILTHILFW